MSAFDAVIETIDQTNAKDPRHCQEEGMAPIPVELLYGIRMSKMCEIYAPEADELVQIAARGQHIERWLIPRDDYPRDRMGYLHWRTQLKKHHAHRVSQIMAAQGYGEQDQTIVSDILLKKNLKRDERTQWVEDLACLVFLKFYAVSFAKDHAPEKIVNILAKTLPKMSDKAHAFADQLDLDAGLLGYIQEAKAKLT